MKCSVALSALGSATLAIAHGLVTQLEIGGVLYDNYSPYVDPYMNPAPERIGWTTPSDGPVVDVTSAGIACNTGSVAGALSAGATAGSAVKFFWTQWPVGHSGPVMTYLAKCPGTDCTTADPTSLNWFKIDDAGLNSDGTWATDTLIAQNNTWTVTIPSDIASGPYLLRHELLALHSAENVDGAQFYPMCANLQVTGSGSAVPGNTVKFPGAYSATDPGILFNIYYPIPTSYVIPGPAVYVPGGSSASTSAAAATSAVPTTSATTISVAATSAAATSAATTIAAAATSAADDSVATSTELAAISTSVANSTTPAVVPVYSTLSGTAPAHIPTLIHTIVPPYANSTITHTRTHTRTRGPGGNAASQTIEPTRSFSNIAAVAASETPVAAPPATTAAPVVVTYTHTETATVEKTVILTFTASAVETVTVAEPAGCTPVGRHRRGTYYF